MKKTILILLSIAFLLSCDKEVGIPAFIFVPNTTLLIGSNQGTGSADIIDIWVHPFSEFAAIQGVYEMPVEFPILEEGITKVFIFGGIEDAGTGIRVKYPFYAADSFTVNLQPQLTDTLRPKVRYNELANFLILEGFESGSQLTNVTRVIRSSPDDPNVFEGNASAKVRTDINEVGVFVSTVTFNLPSSPKNLFVELNYKSNHAFAAAITGKNSQGEFPLIKPLPIPPSTEWRKIYIQFTLELSDIIRVVNPGTFQIDLLIQFNTTPEDVEIYLDNFKLIQS